MDKAKLSAELDKLRKRIAEIARENVELRYQRDVALAKVESLIPIATPEQEEDLERDMASAIPEGLSQVISDMDAKYG